MKVTKIGRKGYYTLREETEYDFVIELAVSSYDLDQRSRKETAVDNKHCLVMWWTKNKDKFMKYKTLESMGYLDLMRKLTKDHSITQFTLIS